MAEAVLDASAILAFLHREAGAEIVREALPHGLVCCVNATEVISKLVDGGVQPGESEARMRQLPCRLVAFDDVLAATAGQLRAETRHLGLSLGDRACLALALAEGLAVLTADRNWAGLDLGLDIQIIR